MIDLLLYAVGGLFLAVGCLLVGVGLAKLEARDHPGQMSARWLRRHLPALPWRRRA